MRAPFYPSTRSRSSTSNRTSKAQDGWKEGSFISVGLKSGTNAIHGTAYAFGRNALATDAARNAFTHTVTPADLEQFGVTAGGRIVKDKLFWFLGYEGLRDVLGDTAVDTIPKMRLTPLTRATRPAPSTRVIPFYPATRKLLFLASAVVGPYNPIGTRQVKMAT